MSSPKGQKRSRDTIEIEQNKRRRLSPEAEKETRANLAEYHHRRQQQPTGYRDLDADGYPIEGPNDQPSPPFDDSEDVRQLERQAEEAARRAEELQRRLEAARRRDRERAQRSRVQGRPQAPSAYQLPHFATPGYPPSHHQSSAFSQQAGLTAPFPAPSQPAHPPVSRANPRSKPNQAGYVTHSNLDHPPRSSTPARPPHPHSWTPHKATSTPPPLPHTSTAPSADKQPREPWETEFDNFFNWAPPNATSTPPTLPQDPHGFYSTSSSSAGKRCRQPWENDFDDFIYEDAQRAAQRRKHDNGQASPVLPPGSNVPYQPQSQGEVQLPSSDGFDLTTLHPARPASACPQLSGTSHAPTVDLSASGLSAEEIRALEVPLAAEDGLWNANVWSQPIDPSLGISIPPPGQGPIDQGFTDEEIQALIRDLDRNNGSGVPAAETMQPNYHQQYTPSAPVQYLGKRGHDVETPRDGSNSQGQGSLAADEPSTKRQKKIQRYDQQGIKLGTDNKKTGEVRFDKDGNMFCVVKGQAIPAAYHNDRRKSLLERASSKGKYKYPSEHGADDHDVMAFHEWYLDVSISDRAKRPGVLYQWSRPKKNQASKDPGFMYDEFDGKLLIDVNNHPIKNWPELPLVISGQVEGLWLECWRRINPSITVADIVARCPNETKKRGDTKTHKLTLPAYGNRMRRDRVKIGTRAWAEREGSALIASRLMELMPNRVLRQIEEENSTGLWRDLTEAEVDVILQVNKGQGNAQKRAGNRTLPEPVKKARDAAKSREVEETLRAMRKEKQEEDEKDARPGDGVMPRVGPSSSAAAARPSSAGEAVEQSFEGPPADYGNPSTIGFPEHTSFDATNVEEGEEGSTLVEPPLEEGDTTLVQEVDAEKAGDASDRVKAAFEEDAELDALFEGQDDVVDCSPLEGTSTASQAKGQAARNPGNKDDIPPPASPAPKAAEALEAETPYQDLLGSIGTESHDWESPLESLPSTGVEIDTLLDGMDAEFDARLADS
ncbi:MAG: hypothetical protein LQ338_004028 [Usnochroma carphineum]|nr:MAG: hypothetical protein LQ338_004028 [Usnochroma carphineum]